MRRHATVLAAVLLAAFAFPAQALGEVSPDDVADDPTVVEQQERLERRRALLDAAAHDLTAAAEAYEHTRAHAHRLENDLDDTQRAENAAARRSKEAQDAFTMQVRASYAARPEWLMTEALLASTDPATALRRAEVSEAPCRATSASQASRSGGGSGPSCSLINRFRWRRARS
jgi:hypothetical protein